MAVVAHTYMTGGRDYMCRTGNRSLQPTCLETTGSLRKKPLLVPRLLTSSDTGCTNTDTPLFIPLAIVFVDHGHLGLVTCSNRVGFCWLLQSLCLLSRCHNDIGKEGDESPSWLRLLDFRWQCATATVDSRQADRGQARSNTTLSCATTTAAIRIWSQ
jgi:hypothetical protein